MTPPLLALMAGLAVLAFRPPSVRLPRSLPWRQVREPVTVRRARELEWLEALVTEVRAGSDPSAALLASSRSVPGVVPRAVAAAQGAGDVAEALRADGSRDPLVRAVAACWDVASGTGAGLAASLATLADAGRENERLHRELRAGLAEPRATAVVLAGLPLVGLALGSLLGSDPLSWLLGSAPGLAVLVAGLALEALGAWWSWRIAVSCEQGL
jgi:tight adherence protein B